MNHSMNHSIQALYQEYISSSRSQITQTEFEPLFIFFPALLVVSGDGQVDAEEWVYVKYLAKFMADTFKKDLSSSDRDRLENEYYKEISYLLKSLSSWEDKFIDSLREYIADDDKLKQDIDDVLHTFAEASGGESEVEQEVIEKIKKRLNIEF
ncbi:MAG: hypothetical protein OHK0038_13390 [Flammeovirgaceae bacterium]